MCAISTEDVTAPTPPGTGVMASTTGSTAAKSASPHRAEPSPFTDTSTTVCPGRTCAAVRLLRTPAAVMMISACRVSAAVSGVREWHTVTAASSRSSSMAAGRPTTAERPMTTACFPAISTP